MIHDDNLELQRRILARIEHEGPSDDPCWRWLGCAYRGIGRITVGSRSREVPRVAYEVFVGEIPDGMELPRREACSAWCCNPWHRTPMTRLERLLREPDSLAARMTARVSCPKGHPYDEDNTLWCRNRSTVQRVCKACLRERHQRRVSAPATAGLQAAS